MKTTCYQNTLALATPQNRDYLLSFIDLLEANGETNYMLAFDKAFKYFTTTENDRFRRGEFPIPERWGPGFSPATHGKITLIHLQ